MSANACHDSDSVRVGPTFWRNWKYSPGPRTEFMVVAGLIGGASHPFAGFGLVADPRLAPVLAGVQVRARRAFPEEPVGRRRLHLVVAIGRAQLKLEAIGDVEVQCRAGQRAVDLLVVHRGVAVLAHQVDAIADLAVAVDGAAEVAVHVVLATAVVAYRDAVQPLCRGALVDVVHHAAGRGGAKQESRQAPYERRKPSSARS
ncbi:hypothetical protein G6F22_017461 [Rhizopus arrhizus]|nr:hypothetical protein G6F22_017461 [Rhizopus arrhizus]